VRRALSAGPHVKLHEVCTWSPYEFANSGYTTVVITAVFGVYGGQAALFVPVTMLIMAGSFAVAATPFLFLRRRALERQADSPAFRAITAT